MKPVVPFSELQSWTRNQERIASQPLALCPEFPRIAARHEAWWRGELEGPPLFVAYANKEPARPFLRRLDLLDRPEAWFEARNAQLRQQHHVGDSFPWLRVDFGPCMLGALLGGRTEFVSDTTWTHPMIKDDWSNMPAGLLKDHPWWSLLERLMELTADRAAGQFIVGTPSLGGSSDLLLNLRGTSELALDVLDQPGKIEEAIGVLYKAWWEAFCRIHDIAGQKGAGLVNWVALWSNRPYYVTECDFCYMLGPTEFEALFLPDVARQAGTVGRSIFHLDGPGSTRHIDALLDTPEIQAIQYVPGAGNSALDHIEMLQKIQRKGRALQITAPASEVLELSKRLEPNSLAFLVFDAIPPGELDDLYTRMASRYK